jgi:hypothetical protein
MYYQRFTMGIVNGSMGLVKVQNGISKKQTKKEGI